MWCIKDMNDGACSVGNNLCMLLKKFQRDKTLGEMWAAVIKTINNLLRMAWLRTRIPNGTKAGVSWFSEGEHAGHILEVPQEEHSPSIYMLELCTNVRRSSTGYQPYCRHYQRINILKAQWTNCWCTSKLTVTTSNLSWSFPCMYIYVVELCVL